MDGNHRLALLTRLRGSEIKVKATLHTPNHHKGWSYQHQRTQEAGIVTFDDYLERIDNENFDDEF